jgi:hypothetical protein
METCSPLSGSESFELQLGRVFNGVISRGCHEAPNLLTWQICDISPTGIARRAFSLRPHAGHQWQAVTSSNFKLANMGIRDLAQLKEFWSASSLSSAEADI